MDEQGKLSTVVVTMIENKTISLSLIEDDAVKLINLIHNGDKDTVKFTYETPRGTEAVLINRKCVISVEMVLIATDNNQ